MAVVNLSSIFNKVNAYSKTPAGKEKMRQAIAKKVKDGVSKTGCGDEILTYSKMSELANELIGTLKNTAASYDLAPSVMAHFDSLTYMVQDIGNGAHECYIYFQDDLSRESLESDDTGEGIRNIIALFNNGYVASSPKYGWWNGHSPTGEAVSRSMTGDENYAFIKSRQSRPSLMFMQRAIDDFCNKYKNKYNMTVMLNDFDYVDDIITPI